VSYNWAGGYLKASPDGKRLAAAWQGSTWKENGFIEVYDFDAATGMVSNAIPIAIPTGVDYSVSRRVPYGLSFSPDSRRLYATTQNPSDNRTPKDTATLFQYNVTLRDSALLAKSQVAIAIGGHAALQLGPDGNIYCVKPYRPYLSVIDKPNAAGSLCSYRDDAVFLGLGFGGNGLPNMIDADGANDQPYPHASRDTTICRGSSVVISATGGATYLWGPADTVPCAACPAMTVTPDSTTAYTVTITKEAGCQFFDTVVVTVVDAVTATAGRDTMICSGGSAQLFSTGGDSSHWSPSAGLSCTDCRNPIATPAKTTKYIVTTSNAAGCIAKDTVTVTVWAGASAGNDTTICAGQSAHLHGSGGVSYAWSPGTGLSCTDCPDPVVRPAVTTRYYVTVTSEAGCTATDSVLVTVIGAGTVDAGLSQTICRGDSVSLSASDGTTWQWSPKDGLNCSDCRNPKASPAATTVYTVTISAAGGCTGSDTVTVTVHPLPDIEAGDDVTLCAGESATLHASGGASYQWSPSEGLSCTDCAEPMANPKSTTTYHVVATSEYGCVADDSVTVTIIDAANVDAGVGGTICSGESVQLQASDGASWQWSPADGLSCTDCRSPKASPASTTLYTVTVTAAGGCSAIDTVSVQVLPLLVIGAGEDIDICVGATTQLHATGAKSYRWSPAEGLSCTDCADPVASPATTTTYTVVGTSADGCTASDEMTVKLRSARIVHASIGRDYHLLPGASVTVPVMLDEAVSGIDTLLVAVEYSREMLRLRDASTAGTVLDGWRREVIADTLGGLSLRVIAPGGAATVPAGALVQLRFDAYLGQTMSSELPLSISLPNQTCLRVERSPGLILLDSICGLSYRMMLTGTAKYALQQNTPNPFNPETEIAFTLGLDGWTVLRVFDMSGGEVARLVEGYLQPGEYTARFDARALPSGMYLYRLESGAWQQSRWMVVVR
jgi:hypothetical protein